VVWDNVPERNQAMADGPCTGWNHYYDADYGVISPISVNATGRGASDMVL